MTISGVTTTAALDNSLNSMVAQARITREFDGVMTQLVDRVTLEAGTGLTWNEVTLGKLTATAVTETTDLQNAQQPVDTNFPITPAIVGILMVLTDRVQRRLAKSSFQKLGGLAQNAIERKKDLDLLTILDGFSTMTGTGAGTTLTTNAIASSRYRISSNATEQGRPPYRAVLHGYQIKDLRDDLVSAVGTYPISDGPTATVFKGAWKLPIADVEVFEDGNITIDSSDDAKGGVFAKEAIVLVQGKTPWQYNERKPNIGGGANAVYHYDEYAAGERLAGGSTSAWGFEIYSDATAPA